MNEIKFSPDGRLLVAVDDLSLNVWRVASRSLIRAFPIASGKGCCCAFLPDSQRVLFGDYTGVVYALNVVGPARRKIFASCGGPILSLDCSPDGRSIVAGGFGGMLHVWDLDSEKLRWRQSKVNALSTSPAIFSADSKTIISGFADSGEERNQFVDLIVRDAETGETRGRLAGHTRHVTKLAISSDWLLHSGSRDGTIRTWDLRSGKEVRRLSAADCRPIEGAVRSFRSFFPSAVGDEKGV